MKCEVCTKDVPRTFQSYARGFRSMCRPCIEEMFPEEEFKASWQGWVITGEDNGEEV